MACVPDFAVCVCLVSFLPRLGSTTCSSGPQDSGTESENLSRVQKNLDLSSGPCGVSSGQEIKGFNRRPRPAICGVPSLWEALRVCPGA